MGERGSTVRTVRLAEPFRLETVDIPEPKPAPGEALVRVRQIGVCGTDIHAYRGEQPFITYPRVLGHELAVEIVEVNPARDAWDAGSGNSLSPGTLCVVIPYLECGRCVACRAGKTNCCERLEVYGVHRDGGMAEWMTVPLEKLIPAAQLSPDAIALVENQSIGAHAVRRAGVRSDEYVLLIGAGSIGLGVVAAAKRRGARVIVLDVDREKLNFCRRVLGVEHTVEAGDSALEAVRSITSGDLATAVFDATGNLQSMNEAYQFAAHGGRLAYVGIVRANLSIPDPELHKRELTILASRNATRDDFLFVMEGMEAGELDVAALVTHRARLEELPTAMEAWTAPGAGVLKAMVAV